MPKQIRVERVGGKPFQVTVPDGCRITFGPWSPPTGAEKFAPSNTALGGTLRIYQGPTKTSEDVIAVFSGVSGFRDLSLDYMEQVVIEEGEQVWKSDEKGYVRKSSVSSGAKWIVPESPPLLESGDSESF